MKNWTIVLFLPLLILGIIVASIVLTPVQAQGDFTLTASPKSVTVAEGANAAAVTITVTSTGGFMGPVDLAVLVAPTRGLGCSLSTKQVTLTSGGSVQAMLNCQGNSAGSYTATVNGNQTVSPGNNLVHSDSATYSVTTQSYQIVVNPPKPNGTAGQTTTTATVTVTSANGFSGTVSLASAGSLACGFSPGSVTLGTSGTSTMTCGGPDPGRFVETVNGTSTLNGIVIFHQGQATFGLHGLVCLADPIQTTNLATACPASPPTFNAPSLSEISTQTPGGQLQLRVAVNVNASDGLNGFDVILVADHTKLQPFDADLTGSLLPASAQILVKCIGGVVKAGPVCAPQDNLDTIHLSAAASNFLTSPPTNGLLFTAVYNIVGDSATSTPISFQTGCGTVILPTSVPPLCIIIENGGGASVPESAQEISASEVTGTAGAIAWAAVQPVAGAATTLNVIAGSGTTAANNIAVNVGNAFTCGGLSCVDLAVVTPRVGGNPVPGLLCTVSPGSVAESLAGAAVSTLSCSTSISTPPGSYTVFVVSASDTSTTPTAGTTYLGSDTSFTLNVGDFKLTPVTQPLYVPKAASGTSTATDQITVSNLGTFSLSVGLTPVALAGFTLALNQTTITIPAGKSHNVTLTATAAATTGLGSFTATIRGVGLGSLRTTTVNIIVAHPTTVSVACTPSSVVNNTATSCGITVTDTFATPSTPTGTVSWFSNSTGTFAPSACLLTGTGASATCSVNYTPKKVAIHIITGIYPGDSTHVSGSSTAQVTSTAPVSFDFTLGTPSPSSLTVAQGSTSPTSSILATLSTGTSVPVTFTVTSVLPNGVTATFSNSPCSPTCTVMVSFSATATATLGTVSVTITGSGGGATHVATLMLTVQAPVTVPTVVVNAPTPNPANTGATVTVTFTVTSTAAVTALTVNWGDGTINTLTVTATSDTHAYANTGAAKSQIFTITVTATNSAGPGSGTTTETINDRPPTVTISSVSPNPVNTGVLVTISFTTADPDGLVSSISVTWGDGTAADTLAGTATSDMHTYNSAGPFTITVTATDNSGSTGFATAPITVNAIGVPTVTVNNPTPNPANTGATVTVTFTVASTVTVTGITVNWGDGTTNTLAGSATSDTHIYANTGTAKSQVFTITVTATNSAGPGIGTTTETVNDRPPVVTISTVLPNPADTGVTATVSFTATDPDGTVSSISVDWGDGSTPTSLGGTATSATHSYANTGNAKTKIFTIAVTATDNSGSTGSANTSETINDRSPVVSVSTVSPNPVNTGVLVTVTFTATDPDGTISSISVNWGDSTTPDSLAGSATSDTHTYNSAGSFTITVTATDNSGSTGSATAPITVNAIGVPTVAVNAPTPNPANTGVTVTVTFTVSSTATVTGLTVNWGDGTINTLAVSATSDTHTYTSTGATKSQVFTITVTATNSAGPGSGTATETVNDRPPTVTVSNVSPNPANTGATVTVTFSATDPDGTIASFTVNWGDTTTPDTLPGTATSDTHMYTSPGGFTITVTATDNSGSTGQATGSVTIQTPVGVPTVTVNSPTPNPANTGATVTVTFTVTSTVTVTGLTVNWGDGTINALVVSATSDTHIYASTGTAKSQTFTITVTATNSAGPGSGATTEAVNDRPPTVTVSTVLPNPANTGQMVTATFSTADPDGTISSIGVNWGDNTAPDTLAGTATSDTHIYNSGGSFTITIIATDNSGSAGQGTGSITVNVPVGIPTVAVNAPTPNPADTGATVTVTFTVTSTATVTGITVNWGDGTTNTLTGSATSDTHIYANTGTAKSQIFTITVTATNSAGPGSGTTTETINDRPPVASFTFTPASPSAGQAVNFDASASTDPDGTIVSYAWNFGDGTTGTGATPTHVYNPTSTQSFTVMLSVTDSQGSTGSTSQSVTVSVAVTPPVVTISSIAPNPANKGQMVTITFAVSSTATITGITVNWGDGTTDPLTGTATSDTHAYTAAGSFTVTVTATNSAGPGSAAIQETVTTVTGIPVLLTFLAQAPQSPSRGPGILQIFVNGQHVTDVTPGMINFTSFGPIDITTFVTFGGQNTVTFVSPQTNQFSLVKNVTVTQGNTILLHVVRTQRVSASGPLNLTFSLPALATTGITVSSASPLVDQVVTFTARFTGGTAPFKCIFQFGDDESAVSQGTSGTCTVTHDFDSSGTFNTTLVIKGSSTSDRVVAHLHVNVLESSDIDDD